MRVYAKHDVTVPFFAGTTSHVHLYVEGAPADERPFCSIALPQPDPSHSLYAEYVQGLYERADDLANIINAGLAALGR